MTKFSIEQKTEHYAGAVIEALAAAGTRLGEPDINAAIVALTVAQAYLLAKIDDPTIRALAVVAASEGVGLQTAEQYRQRIEREQGNG